MYDEIIEQLTTYCDCIPEEAFEEKNKEKLERNIEELIFLVSMLTCWTQNPCETLLNQKRTEFLDVHDFDACNCDEGIIEFRPFYSSPIDLDSFEVFLISKQGIKEESEKINEDYFSYSEFSNMLRIDVRPYIESATCCPCKTSYQLMIRYNAGFETIPECLLPIMCDMLHIIYSKNNCGCDECQECKQKYTDDDIEIIEDEEVTVEVNIKRTLWRLLHYAYRGSLGTVSLCNRRLKQVWGVVV